MFKNTFKFSKKKTASLVVFHQLKSFLHQRLAEMQGEDDILSVNQFQSAPVVLQMKTVDDIQRLLSSVSGVLGSITDTRIHHLLLLKSSPK